MTVPKSISHHRRGNADITEPIKPRENDRFILHDSMGFEHGDSKEFTIAKEFIESRSRDSVPLEKRVHVIWRVCFGSILSTLI
jgi:hypothetical protein